MAKSDKHGPTPFEYLRGYYESTLVRCEACGHVDRGAEWEVHIGGAQIRYSHTCPGCDRVRVREVRTK
jgi:ribosome-binding protein aMBF1 (putative translation factor)